MTCFKRHRIRTILAASLLVLLAAVVCATETPEGTTKQATPVKATPIPSPTVEPTAMAEPTPTPMPPQYFIPFRPFERPILITGVPPTVSKYAKWCAYERHPNDMPFFGRRWTWQEGLTTVIRRSASEWNRITPPNELRDFHAAMVAIQDWWLQYAESQDPDAEIDLEVDYRDAINAFHQWSGREAITAAEYALPLSVFQQLVKWECTYGPTPTPEPTATAMPEPTNATRPITPTPTPTVDEVTNTPTPTATPQPTNATATWRGLVLAPEGRCSSYDSDDYPYSQSVEAQIVADIGGIYGPYTGRWFASQKDTDIEHIVARSEAHDSGLCAANDAMRREFAADLLNLTLAGPSVNRHQKSDKDAAEWLPDLNKCWFADRIVQVRLKYELTVDQAEADALGLVLTGCSSVEMVVVSATESVIPTPIPLPGPDEDALALWDDNGNGRITCDEARRHGIVPVPRGHPAYQYMRDADDDGIVCES